MRAILKSDRGEYVIDYTNPDMLGEWIHQWLDFFKIVNKNSAIPPIEFRLTIYP